MGVGRLKQPAAFLLAGVLSLSGAGTAFAMEKPADMAEDTWVRLQDNKLEYDEIENLIIYYNPVYRSAADSVNAQKKPYEDAVNELISAAASAEEDARDAKEAGDVGAQTKDKTIAKVEREAARSFRKVLRQIDGKSRTSLKRACRQLSCAVQKLVIGYQMAASSIELLNTTVELTEASYQSALTQRNLGMAADADVAAAEKSAVSAKNSLQSAIDQMNYLRQTICTMTGWNYQAEMEIGEIPAPDMDRIATMDPETEAAKAVSYNADYSSLIDQSGKGDVNRAIKFRSMDETEAKIKNQLEVLYQTVLENKSTYDGAASAYQSAQLTWEGNNRRYEMGMLGRLEYLGVKAQYLQAKMNYDMAVLNLKQSMEDYEWALYGIITLD